jgi:hypothetical protein
MFLYTIYIFTQPIHTQIGSSFMVRKLLFFILILAILVLGVFNMPVTDIATAFVDVLEELTLPPDTIKVNSNEQIIEAVTDTIKAEENIVNFDTHELKEAIATDSTIYSIIMASNPDIKDIKEIHSLYNADRQYLSIVIVYNYYVNNQDIFCVIEKPGLCAVLDKRVLLAGESAQIDLQGEYASAYDLYITSSDPSIQIGENDRITGITEGTAYLHFTIAAKSDSNRQYSHKFKIYILPEDVPQINDIGGLMAAAKKDLDKTSHSILISNENLTQREIQKALEDIGEGYIACTLDDEMTTLYNDTYSGDSLIECTQKIRLIEETVAEIVSGITRPDMTDLEKETAIYHYLIQNVAYDYRVYDDPKNYPFDSSTIYGPLINGTGVCTGYAYALEELLDAVGIECMTVLGIYENQYHMWNIAKIDGVYYQLDPTFDSVYTHSYRALSHEYFNISDEKMGNDHEWDTSAYPLCTDTRYD